MDSFANQDISCPSCSPGGSFVYSSIAYRIPHSLPFSAFVLFSGRSPFFFYSLSSPPAAPLHPTPHSHSIHLCISRLLWSDLGIMNSRWISDGLLSWTSTERDRRITAYAFILFRIHFPAQTHHTNILECAWTGPPDASVKGAWQRGCYRYFLFL